MEVFLAHLLDHLNHIVFQFAINSLQVESVATLESAGARGSNDVQCSVSVGGVIGVKVCLSCICTMCQYEF